MPARPRHWLRVASLALLLPALRAWGGADAPGRVVLDYYRDPDCDECRRVSETVLPMLTAHYAERIALRHWDTRAPEVAARLLGELDRLGAATRNERVHMVLDRREVLCGAVEIETRLIERLEARLAATDAGAAPLSDETPSEPVAAAARRARAWTLGAVMLAGLVDGINPCAVATLVFLASLLTLGGARPRLLLGGGGAYVLSCYLTYYLLGLGLLSAWRVVFARPGLRIALDLGGGLALLALGALSFMDAARAAGGAGAAMRLTLPERWRERVRRLLREGAGAAWLPLGMAGVGVLVTLIESVCTGQVLIPTLALLARAQVERGRALALLAVYNLMFVLPLLVVLAVSLAGVRAVRWVGWSRREAVWGKRAMGALFVAGAVWLWVT